MRSSSFPFVALVGYQHHGDPAHSIPFYGCSALDILNVCVLLHLVLPMSRPITIPMLDIFLCFVLYHIGDFFAGAFFQDKSGYRIYPQHCSNIIKGHSESCIKLHHWRFWVGNAQARHANGSLFRHSKAGAGSRKLPRAFVQLY
jgi:hypothetical protein